MAEINDKDRNAFGEAHTLLGLDLTPSEQKRIAELADELRRILEAAKARMRPTRIPASDGQEPIDVLDLAGLRTNRAKSRLSS